MQSMMIQEYTAVTTSNTGMCSEAGAVLYDLGHTGTKSKLPFIYKTGSSCAGRCQVDA